MKRKKTRTAYLISLGDKQEYEYNLENELLIFDNLEQIAEYCNVNYINYENVVVHETQVWDEPIDLSTVDEVEF